MEVFAISPASAKPLWFLGIICLLLVLMLVAFTFLAYSSRNSKIKVAGDHIKIVGDFWGRKIPLNRLQIPKARIVNLNHETQYLPKRRTFGTGLPGYSSGWFRLHNKEKALLYLTKRDQVVYIPTYDDYSLLFSLENPNQFIEIIKKWQNEFGLN